ncbi:MAG: DUF308 domain-containing protein [Lachnospiraceae bacterium]|nr:DUF308 domain-containing protein [Lachnospiraceae bacterium]
MKYVKQIKTCSIIHALLAILAGLLFCMRPESANDILITVVCILLIIGGVISLAEFFLGERYLMETKGSMFSGILKLLIGIFLLSHKVTATVFLGFLFSIYILTEGITGIEKSVHLLHAGISGSVLSLILNILVTAAGVVLVFCPWEAVATMSLYIGITLILDGITRLLTVHALKKAGQRFWNSLHRNFDDDSVIDTDYTEL